MSFLRTTIFLCYFLLMSGELPMQLNAQVESEVVDETESMESIDSTQLEEMQWDDDELKNPSITELQEKFLIVPELEREDIFFYRGLGEENRNNQKNLHSIFFVYFLTILSLLGVVLMRFPEYMNLLRRSFRNFRVARIYYEDEEYSHSLPILLMHLLHVMVAGGLVFLAVKDSSMLQIIPHVYLLLVSILGVGLLFLLRYSALSAFSRLFPVGKYFGFFLYNQVILQMMMALICLPFLMSYVYATVLPKEWLGMTLMALVLTFLIYVTYRGMLIAIPLVRMRPFHFILYLCAFEIAPLILLFGLYREVVA